MLYEMKNRRAKVTINDFGAELTSVVIDDVERLWQNSDGTWDGHAPQLFPVCGHFSCRIDGKDYPMPPHGFAKKCIFHVVNHTDRSLIFSLVSNEETKKYYPYEFVYTVEYRLKGRKIVITHKLQNTAETPLFFACGGHESFSLDKGLSDYKLVFPLTETFVHRPHNKEGYLTGDRKTLGVGKELIVPDSYLYDNQTVILENLRSSRVSLCETDGTKKAEITFKNFPNLLLWRPESARMLCIEPWLNLPDEAGAYPKEFSKKPGLIRVEGLQSKKLKRTIRYY